MYTHAYTCTFVHYMHGCILVHTHICQGVCLCGMICILIHILTRICVHQYIYIHTFYAYMYAYTHIHPSGGLLEWENIYSHAYIDKHMCIQLHIHIHTYIIFKDVYIYIDTSIRGFAGAGYMYMYEKLQVSFAKEPYKTDDVLQKRPIIQGAYYSYPPHIHIHILTHICVYTRIYICICALYARMYTDSYIHSSGGWLAWDNIYSDTYIDVRY